MYYSDPHCSFDVYANMNLWTQGDTNKMQILQQFRLTENTEKITWVTTKHEHICPLASQILQKRTHTFQICRIFQKRIFVLLEIVCKHKYDSIYVEIRSYLMTTIQKSFLEVETWLFHKWLWMWSSDLFDSTAQLNNKSRSDIDGLRLVK